MKVKRLRPLGLRILIPETCEFFNFSQGGFGVFAELASTTGQCGTFGTFLHVGARREAKPDARLRRLHAPAERGRNRSLPVVTS